MVKVKICGLTNVNDVMVACELGADMVGVVVRAPKSPRNLTLERAKVILRAIPKTVVRVAVTTASDLAAISKVAGKLKPDYLQIHSSFSAEQLWRVNKLGNVGIIGVISIPQRAENMKAIVDQALEISGVVDYLLLDTKKSAGGRASLTHDWRVSRRIREAVDKLVFLAGGLNPTNVKDAIRFVRPYGVDVSSGVESSPGKKDVELMKAFIDAARVM